jgi:hypothetical protein
VAAKTSDKLINTNTNICGHPYCKGSYRFGFEICSYSQHGFNLDGNQFMDIYVIHTSREVGNSPS